MNVNCKDASRQHVLDDHHDCSQNWNVVARPLGYETGVHIAMSSS